MSIRARLFLAFGVALGLLVAQAAISGLFVAELQQAAEEMASSAEGFQLTADASASIASINDHVGRLPDSDQQAELFAAVRVYWTAAEEQLGALVRICSRFDLAGDAAKLREGVQEASREIKALSGALAQDDAERVFEQSLYVEESVSSLGETIGSVSVQLSRTLRDALALERRVHAKPIQASIAITAIAVFLLSLVGVVFANRIVKPVRAVVSAMEKLAQGNLTVRLPDASRDELGALARAVNGMVESLSQLIRGVQQAADDVNSSSSGIASGGADMAQGMERQQRETSRAAAAVEQSSSSIAHVAQRAAAAADRAAQAGELAGEGGMAVQQTVGRIRTISDEVNASAAAVGELGKRGEQIGAVIAVINDIADQTNLLALNAAIEAARAGEHGRGFAVVADEVRKLAERTTQATEEVAESIKAIQSETARAVERMNASQGAVNEGVSMAEATGDSLQSIVDAAQEVATMVREIASASEQQRSASTEISRNVEAIDTVTSDSAEAVRRTARSAEELSAQAQQLRELVGAFRVEADAAGR